MTALNIEVHGKPDSLRANARWLRARAEDVHAAGTGIRQARTGSEAGWGGVAGPAFRTTMSAVGPKVDGLSDDFTGTGRALESHADDLDTVRSRMAQARQIASAAGLRVSDTEITAPGPPPPAPQRLDPGKCYAPEVQRAHDNAVSAQNAYGTKVVAYHQATETVLEARRIETNSQSALTRFLGDVADPRKAPLTITDFGSGLAAAQLEKTSKFRAEAAKYERRIRELSRIADNKTLPLQEITNAERDRIAARQKADIAKLRAAESKLARAVDKLPQNARRLLRVNVGDGAWAKKVPGLTKALPVLRRVPVIGVITTAAGVGMDIAEGKNPVQSAAAGLGGLAAGAGIGMVVGGPPGAVLGFIGGAITSHVIGEYGDDIVGAVVDAGDWTWDRVNDAAGWTGERLEDATDWAGDRLEDTGDWLGDRAEDAGDWFEDRWNDVTGR